jgi:hypothetical protein
MSLTGPVADIQATKTPARKPSFRDRRSRQRFGISDRRRFLVSVQAGRVMSHPLRAVAKEFASAYKLCQ